MPDSTGARQEKREAESVLMEAIRKALTQLASKDTLPTKREETNLENKNQDELLDWAITNGLSLSDVLAEAAVWANRESQGENYRSHRTSLEFFLNKRTQKEMSFTDDSDQPLYLSTSDILEVVNKTNIALELIYDVSQIYGVDLYEILGLRNLSSFVGEVFAKELAVSFPDLFFPNPNQDGYPDLCALTEDGQSYIDAHTDDDERIRRDKELWSPYPYGGIEIKATCGNTPPARDVRKPLIGESRYPILKDAEWKAHHQDTKRLLGCFWDFIDGLPTILAVFYRNDLDTTRGQTNLDWGAVVQPREEGGRTTSVSLMKKNNYTNPSRGVKKMAEGWVILPRDCEIINAIGRAFRNENIIQELCPQV